MYIIFSSRLSSYPDCSHSIIHPQLSSSRPDPNTAFTSARPETFYHLIYQVSKKIVGEYVGNGSIILDNEVVERILGITIVIESKSGNEVYIRLVENNGNDFFDTKLLYTVNTQEKSNRKKSDDIVLIQSGIPSSKIIIDKNGFLKFENPRIEIDGDVYTLRINAERQ